MHTHELTTTVPTHHTHTAYNTTPMDPFTYSHSIATLCTRTYCMWYHTRAYRDTHSHAQKVPHSCTHKHTHDVYTTYSIVSHTDVHRVPHLGTNQTCTLTHGTTLMHTQTLPSPQLSKQRLSLPGFLVIWTNNYFGLSFFFFQSKIIPIMNSSHSSL